MSIEVKAPTIPYIPPEPSGFHQSLPDHASWLVGSAAKNPRLQEDFSIGGLRNLPGSRSLRSVEAMGGDGKALYAPLPEQRQDASVTGIALGTLGVLGATGEYALWRLAAKGGGSTGAKLRRWGAYNAVTLGTLGCAVGHVTETAWAPTVTETPRPVPTEFLSTISQKEVAEELNLWAKPGVIPGFTPKDILNADLENVPDGKIGYYYNNSGLRAIGLNGKDHGSLELGYIEGVLDGVIPDRKFIVAGKDDIGAFSWHIEKTGALDASRSSGIIKDAQGRVIGSAILYDISDADKRFYTVTLFGNTSAGNVTYDLYPYGDVSRPVAALEGLVPALPVVDATNTPEALATTTATPIPEPTATATPEVAYPAVFDQAEDILTPEKLPVVSMDDVLSGKHAEMVLEMYKKGLIRQISPAAKPYPFQWGNAFADKIGRGTPIVMNMTRGEYLLYEQNPAYSFVLFRTEQAGEPAVLVDFIWLNKDGTVDVTPWTRSFSAIQQHRDNSTEYLKAMAPFPYYYGTSQDCLKITSNSQAYCDYHMSVQEEWLRLVQEWVETGIVPAGLSRIPLHFFGGTTIGITGN